MSRPLRWLFRKVRPRQNTAAALLCGATLLLYADSPALAYEEQIAVGTALGYGTSVNSDEFPAHAIGAELSANFGLDDTWAIIAHGAFFLHPGSQTAARSLLGAELIYLVDVLRWVPFFGAGVFGSLDWVDSESSLGAGLNAILGIDYLLSRDWALGLDLRPYIDLSGPLDEASYFTATLRLSAFFEI